VCRTPIPIREGDVLWSQSAKLLREGHTLLLLPESGRREPLGATTAPLYPNPRLFVASS